MQLQVLRLQTTELTAGHHMTLARTGSPGWKGVGQSGRVAGMCTSDRGGDDIAQERMWFQKCSKSSRCWRRTLAQAGRCAGSVLRPGASGGNEWSRRHHHHAPVYDYTVLLLSEDCYSIATRWTAGRKEASTRDLVAVIQGRGLLSFLGETALAQGDIAFPSLLSPWCGFGAHDTGCGREGDEARGGD